MIPQIIIIIPLISTCKQPFIQDSNSKDLERINYLCKLAETGL